MRTWQNTRTLKGFPLFSAVINRLFLTLSVLDGEMHLGTDSCFAPASCSGRRFPKALIIIPQALRLQKLLLIQTLTADGLKPWGTFNTEDNISVHFKCMFVLMPNLVLTHNQMFCAKMICRCCGKERRFTFYASISTRRSGTCTYQHYSRGDGTYRGLTSQHCVTP